MSKVVKAVVGAALMYYSLGAANFLVVGGNIGAITAAQAAMLPWISGAITLVGASLAGSALAPEMPDMGGSDAYAGQKLQTKKDNVSAVAEIFGENRVGTNIIWQGTSEVTSGADNRDYWAIQTLGNGELESYEQLYAGVDEMIDKGDDKWTLKYTHCKVYTTSGATALALNDVVFIEDTLGTERLGAELDAFTPYTLLSTQLTHGKDGGSGSGLLSWNPDKLVDSSYTWEEFNGGARFREWETSENNWIQITLDQAERVTRMSVYIGETAQLVSGSVKAQYYDGTNWVDASSAHSFWNNDDGASGLGLATLDTSSTETAYTLWRLFFPSVSCQGNNVRLFEVELATASIEAPMSIPANTSFIATHQVFEPTDTAHTQLDSITATVKGKKIDGVYSNNPAVIVEHLLKDSLNIDSSAIDSASFTNAEAKCNEYGYTANISFYQQVNIQSAIRDVLATCRGQIVFSQGKWKLKIDEKNATVVKALTSDDILNSSLSVSMKGFQEIVNKIDLKYINPIDNWLSAKVEKNDVDLISMDGQEITKTLDVKGITNTAQADKLAEITLNSMRYTEDEAGNRIKQTPLAISFATTIKNAELEVGDVISLDHELLGARVRKFVILSVETDQSGAIQVSAREYCETHYKDSSGVYII